MFISSTKTLKIELNGDGRFIASLGVERPEGQQQEGNLQNEERGMRNGKTERNLAVLSKALQTKGQFNLRIFWILGKYQTDTGK